MIQQFDLLKQYQSFSEEISTSIMQVLDSGNYVLGSKVSEFEKTFSEYLGSSFGIGVANGTDALILALKYYGIGPGDEVITTCFTAIPTSSAIIATGATPVFVDIDSKTLLMDIEKMKSKVTSKTKAIIAVHLFGNVVNVGLIKKLFPLLPVIEDACQSHGSTLDGVKAGNLGDIGCYSFYPTKNLGAYGDGGFISTNDKEIFEKLKLLRMYGMVTRDEIVINGINSRLDEMQAAILSVKLKYLEKMNIRRRDIANRYTSELKNFPLEPQLLGKGVISNYHIFTLKIAEGRDKIVSFLNENDINVNIYYKNILPLQPANKYMNLKAEEFSNAIKVCSEIFSLPLYAELSDEQVSLIIKTVKKYFGE